MVKTFSLEERSQTYALGCELAEQGKNIFISCSKDRYSIWMNMRLNSVEQKSAVTFPGITNHVEFSPTFNQLPNRLKVFNCAV